VKHVYDILQNSCKAMGISHHMAPKGLQNLTPIHFWRNVSILGPSDLRPTIILAGMLDVPLKTLSMSPWSAVDVKSFRNGPNGISVLQILLTHIIFRQNFKKSLEGTKPPNQTLPLVNRNLSPHPCTLHPPSLWCLDHHAFGVYAVPSSGVLKMGILGTKQRFNITDCN